LTSKILVPPAQRPKPLEPAPAGQRWTAVADPETEWRPAGPDGTCRWRGSHDSTACGDAASVETKRGIKRTIWWRYCPADAYVHYGRWLEDGKVMHWELEPDEGPPS
jgi:hypothetical protein